MDKYNDREEILTKLSLIEKEFENQKNKNKILNEKIEKQNKEIEKIKNSIKLETKNMNKKLYIMKDELEKVKIDINLIKSKGALETFIDFFYRGYNLQGAKSYEEKISQIENKLNQHNDIHKNDIEIVNMLRSLLKKSALMLDIDNFEGLNIDKSKPILPQLFKVIVPNGNYDKIEEQLKTIFS